MKQFSYQKYYSLCRFNYVCLSFNYVRLLFNCLLVVQLCPFVFQLCLLVVQLLYLIMPASHSITFDIIFQLLLLRAFLARGLQMASKEIQNVSDSEGKGENYQRALTLLNEAVDILRSPCTSRDHPQQLPAHRYVGSVQVPATSERGELQEMARLFPFYSQGASAGKVSSRQPFKRFRPSASSNGPKKSFKPKETWTHTFICLTVNQTSCSAFKIGESKRSRSPRKKNYFRKVRRLPTVAVLIE